MKWKTSYENEIKNKNIVVGKKIKLTLKRITQLKKRYTFDQEEADYFIDFIETFCKHFEGAFAGKPFELSLWQKVIVETIFGLKNEEGLRVIREAFVVVARKNGKSTFASALAIAMLIADGEEGAQIYSVANKLEQASVIYKSCYQMATHSKSLQKAIRKTRTSLEYKSSVLKALASDSKSLDGLNPHLAIYDEGHATKNNDLYDVLKSAFGMREQPLMLHITTAGTVRNGVFDYLYKYSEDVLNGKVNDDTFIPFIYEVDSVRDLKDPKNWEKANPNIGVSVKRDYLETELERANNSPVAKSGVYTKNFNIAQSQSKAFFMLNDLKNDLKFDFDKLRGNAVIVGVDLSSTTDLTCVSWLIPYEDKLLVHQKYFIPENTVEQRELEEKVRYDAWIETGYVDTCEGSQIRIRQVADYITETMYKQDLYVQRVAIDGWGASDFVRILEEEHGLVIENIRQGAKTFSVPMKRMLADFKDGNIIHNNNPLFIWNTTNVGVERDNNDGIRPIKGNGTRGRIDGFMAHLDAYTCYQNLDSSTLVAFDYQKPIEIAGG